MRPATPSEIELHARAGEAAQRAHAPYSGFRVGAAVVAEGAVEPIVGVNVENASFGLTCCAERVALFTAVAAGHRKVTAIAVHAGGDTVSPCGACRQVLAELAPDAAIVFRRDGELVAASLAELLPEPFAL